MVQIDNQKIGAFIAAKRKEGNMTQKELGDKLFVSDKTVSKWERGLSIPNVVLLIPLAEVLHVSVTELLRGEQINEDQVLNADEVERLVTDSLDLTLQHTIKQRRQGWRLAYLISLLIGAAEITLLLRIGLTWHALAENVLLFMGMMYLFAGWFCFFAKELLPSYYDENKINYYAQGVFRIHLAGLRFNNSNWPIISIVMKAGMLLGALLYPFICLVSVTYFGITFWDTIKIFVMFGLLLALLLAVYAAGKKYE